MTSKDPDKSPLPDGVYVVELSGPVKRAGFEIINGTIQHASHPLHDWLRANWRQVFRAAQRVGDVGAVVDFPVGRPNPPYAQQEQQKPN